MNKFYMPLLCLGLLLGSCDDKEDDPDPVVITDDMGGDPVDPVDPVDPNSPTPDVSGVTGFDLSSTDVAGWELVFEDEFNAGLSNWNIWTGGAFNNERQHYQASNLYTEGGYLFIQEKRENVTGATTPFNATTRNFDFTSGRIESAASYSPGNTSGATKLRISARILLPEGAGLWPAFWTYGDPWPTQGEIDILEFRGMNTTEYVSNFFYGTTAGQIVTNPGQTTRTHQIGTDLTMNWHVFELVWSEDTLEMMLDGEVLYTYAEAQWNYIDDMFNKTQRIILNVAVGGDFFNGMNLDVASIPDESFLAVDWVRVYKQ